MEREKKTTATTTRGETLVSVTKPDMLTAAAASCLRPERVPCHAAGEGEGRRRGSGIASVWLPNEGLKDAGTKGGSAETEIEEKRERWKKQEDKRKGEDFAQRGLRSNVKEERKKKSVLTKRFHAADTHSTQTIPGARTPSASFMMTCKMGCFLCGRMS